jgi:hypothetical protein
MRRICFLSVCTFYLITASILVPRPAHAGTPDSIAAPMTQGGESGRSYTPDQIRSTSAERFLLRMLEPEPGYWRFAALNALAQKVKGSDANARRSILAMVIRAMHDKSRNVNQRWQCCYVISGSGSEAGIPDLIDVLLHDPLETMRAVAAEALGKMSSNAAAHDALLQAARTETSTRVREVLAKYLGKDMPALDPSLVPVAAHGVEELAPSGPPQPPPGPEPPVAEPLPWPFPGDSKAQKIFNN